MASQVNQVSVQYSEPTKRTIIVEYISGEGWYVTVQQRWPLIQDPEVLKKYGPTKKKPSKSRLLMLQHQHFGGYACDVFVYE